MDSNNKFRKLFKEDVSLTEEGKQFLNDFVKSLGTMFDSDEVKSMSEGQKKILGSVLSNMVGTKVADSILEHTLLMQKLNSLSDEEFDGYLKTKYGEKWLFVTLTPEEWERSRGIAKKKISEIMEGVREKMSKLPPYMPLIPRRPFRR